MQNIFYRVYIQFDFYVKIRLCYSAMFISGVIVLKIIIWGEKSSALWLQISFVTARFHRRR